MLLLNIAQLLCSGIPDELCASCFEKPNEGQVMNEGEGAERKERGMTMEGMDGRGNSDRWITIITMADVAGR